MPNGTKALPGCGVGPPDEQKCEAANPNQRHGKGCQEPIVAERPMPGLSRGAHMAVSRI